MEIKRFGTWYFWHTFLFCMNHDGRRRKWEHMPDSQDVYKRQVLSWMILRSLPLPKFSAKPSGSTARCSDTDSRRLVATRNADRWEHISAAM